MRLHSPPPTLFLTPRSAKHEFVYDGTFDNKGFESRPGQFSKDVTEIPIATSFEDLPRIRSERSIMDGEQHFSCASKKLRDEIETLRRERAVFDDIYRKLGNGTCSRKLDIPHREGSNGVNQAPVFTDGWTDVGRFRRFK